VRSNLRSRFALAQARKWTILFVASARCIHAAELAKSGETLTDATPPSWWESGDFSFKEPRKSEDSLWNFHVQNTDVLQMHGRFPAQYSGSQSLQNRPELIQTVSLDLFAGFRLWNGAEVHADAMMWQGFGLSHTFGVAGFPNNEAFKTGTEVPNVTFAHLFIRQTIGFGGEQELVPDGQLQLAGKQDVSRLTLTLGKISAKDSFDGNAYANDGRTQFFNWALVSNGAWDFPADSLGYIPGFTADLHQADWSARYGFFQVPRVANGLASDPDTLRAWSMAWEIERRYQVAEHPGSVHLMSFLTRARMRNFAEAVADPGMLSGDTPNLNYRYKYGLGVSIDQELLKSVGAFMRLGWNDGRTESWAYTDIDKTASAGLSFKGDLWGRSADVYGIAGILNGISGSHQSFLGAGGTGPTIGDGALSYGHEVILETYYDFQIWKTIRGALDYQFVDSPAYNQARGPVSIFLGRIHWEF
jgi:high affinity Mn2+ porin